MTKREEQAASDSAGRCPETTIVDHYGKTLVMRCMFQAGHPPVGKDMTMVQHVAIEKRRTKRWFTKVEK